MANSKVIIVEGPQGAGKTTITNYIRDIVPHTNLYRLNGISDSTKTGLQKSEKMYIDLLDYMKNMENLNINLLFDRTFFSEENYCRLGYKEYSFTEVYKKLVKRLNDLDFDIYYINLYLEDTLLFEQRLKRDEKAGPKYAKYKAENSINQQNTYLEMANEIEKDYKNIKVFNLKNDVSLEKMHSKIKEILDIK